MHSVSLIGIGRLGGALALALAAKGYRVETLIFRNEAKAEVIAGRIVPSPEMLPFEGLSQITSDIIIITTQDSEIGEVSSKLASNLQHRPFVFHTSGSLSSDALSGLAAVGCKTGSIHPLVSISDAVLGAERFAGSYFCVEGDTEAIDLAEEIVESLGGIPFSVETKYKALYHAAAVTACGHLVALIDVAIEMMSKCGLEKEQAKKVLLPLIKSTVENLEIQNPAEALTGTFARADVETFQRHLASLKENVSGDATQIYLELGLRSLELAERQGADAEEVRKLRERVLLALNALK